jgi:hypothetical protein
MTWFFEPSTPYGAGWRAETGAAGMSGRRVTKLTLWHYTWVVYSSVESR